MDKIVKTPTMGEILLEDFMIPMNISAYKLAKDINVPVSRIQDIVHDRRRISVDTALRLAAYFGLSEKHFINIQEDIDIRNAKQQIGEELSAIKKVAAM